MNIVTAKILGRHIQKLLDNKSLSGLWVRNLHRLMQCNKDLCRYVLKMCYDNCDLRDVYEWKEVSYTDFAKNDLSMIHQLKKFPYIKCSINDTWATIQVDDSKAPKFNRRMYLYSFPTLKLQDIKGNFRLLNAFVRYGKPEIRFEVNRNSILDIKIVNKSNLAKLRQLVFFISGKKNISLNLIQPYVDKLLKGAPYEYPSKFNVSDHVPLDIKLYHYQRENVKWILDREKKSPYKIDYVPAIGMGKYWINPLMQKITKEPPEHETLCIYGGAILDQVGLGKTIVMLTACYLNRPQEIIGTPDRTVTLQFKRLCKTLITSKASKNFGKECGKSTQDSLGYCKTHLKRFLKDNDVPPTDTTPPPPLNYIWSEIERGVYDPERRKLKTAATLILCPNQLPSHWIQQLNHFKNRWDVNVLRVISKNDYERVTYKDIVNADFVICTFDFISMNATFCHTPHIKAQLQSSELMSQQQPAGQNCDEPRRQWGVEILKSNRPYFLNFHWRRIIVDEIHEVESQKFKNSALKSTLCTLSSDYKWCLSGSAFINNLESYRFMMDYLYSNEKDSVNHADSYLFLKSYHHKRILDNCFRCNTKKSTTKETSHIPPITYNNTWINLTDTEHAMYHTRLCLKKTRTIFADECLQQVCCSPFISPDFKTETNGATDERLTLKQIHTKMNKMVEKKIEDTKTSIRMIGEDMKFYHQEKKYAIKSNDLDLIESYTKEISKAKSARTRENNLLGKLEEVLKLYSASGTKGKVPKSNNIVPKNALINKYGSKVAYLITFLSKDMKAKPNDKYIIFSQWDTFIQEIASVLNDNDISSYSCKGNVFSKRKAITSFKDNSKDGVFEKNIKSKKSQEQFRVILLSTKGAASGLDLIEANNVIFIDPIYGTKTKMESIETQSIGRAVRLGQTQTINVYRFFTKGTIEEDAFNILHSEDSFLPSFTTTTKEVEVEEDDTSSAGVGAVKVI